MDNMPETRPSLLIRIRNPRDNEAWEEFTQIYMPLIRHYVRKKGLQDADAADLAQEVFRAVMGAVGRWDPDPARGTFRGWLYRVISNATYDHLARRGRQPQASGTTSIEQKLAEQPASEADRTDFEIEYERRVFDWACEQVRGEFREATWRAFWMAGVEGRPGQEVAGALGLSVGAVYIAKSRVMARVRAVVEQIEGGA